MAALRQAVATTRLVEWGSAVMHDLRPLVVRFRRRPRLFLPPGRPIDVEVRFVPLPPGVRSRLLPSRDTVGAVVTGATPRSVLEVSDTVLAGPQPVEVLGGLLAQAGEQVHAWFGPRRVGRLLTGHQAADRLEPDGRRAGRRTAADLGKIRRLHVLGQQAATGVPGTSQRIVAQLATMGLLPDQRGVEHARAALGRDLTTGIAHREIALRMLDTRATPSPEAVIEAVGAAADRFVHRSPVLVGSQLTPTPDGVALRLKVAVQVAGSEQRILAIPVDLVDALPANAAVQPVAAATGQLLLQVRADASDLAIELELVAILSELAIREHRQRYTMEQAWQAAVEAQLQVLRPLLPPAGRADRAALTHLLYRMRDELAAAHAPAAVVAVVDGALERAGERPGVLRSAGALAIRVLRTQNPGSPHLLLYLIRRALDATSNSAYSAITNPPAGRILEQTLQSTFRNFFRSVGGQVIADKLEGDERLGDRWGAAGLAAGGTPLAPTEWFTPRSAR